METAKKLKFENPDREVFVLGELIHNTDVIEELERLGVRTLNDVPERGSGICIVRSHGEAPETIEKIEAAGFELVDLTCPDVKKVQQKAVELAKAGYFVVVVGESSHPEVVAIKANAQIYGEVIVASSAAQLRSYDIPQKVGVVVQTTQRISTLNEIVEYLEGKDLQVANTICASTAMRQTEAQELAQNSDLMLVVGSKKSANTTHLAEILKNITKTIHIENDRELDAYKDLIENAQNIAITAGASTPQTIIEKVITKIGEEK